MSNILYNFFAATLFVQNILFKSSFETKAYSILNALVSIFCFLIIVLCFGLFKLNLFISIFFGLLPIFFLFNFYRNDTKERLAHELEKFKQSSKLNKGIYISFILILFFIFPLGTFLLIVF
jgi:hypothetical protein